ncbi:pumilio homolog 5-like isoform X1 [Malania oleifera]|uniref:pumilio homolog 5-like isoform X1 n=1 Tax=Malania oleifera TaxID=397392 RepID=UPI0025AE9582|nr:pumilio homolog 5-like isoform X1 [Malania oleifera]
MATESPIRIVETSRKWVSHKETVTFAPSSANVAAGEVRGLLKGHRFDGSSRDMVPNRSGSAPPSIEGSFTAIENLRSQRNFSLNMSMTSLDSAVENHESEEQLRADPAYLAYYCSNVNLNPRLPPPLIPRGIQQQACHIGGFVQDWRLTSSNDRGDGFLQLQGTLSTHREDPEDDKSPQHGSDDWAERSCGFLSRPDTGSLAEKHKSLVDLIQNDFPRTPSPVYNQPRPVSHGSTEEVVDHDADSSVSHDPYVSTSNAVASTVGAEEMGSSLNADSSNAHVSRSFSLDSTGCTSPTLPLHKEDPNNLDIHVEDEALFSGVTDSDVTSIESEMKAVNLSSFSNPENHRHKEWQLGHQNNLLQQQVCQQQSSTFQIQGAKSRMISQEMNHAYIGMDQLLHGPSKLSSAEVQPVLQSSGFNPPLYATAAAYMTSANSFYPNLQPPGLFSPQYGVGGYAMNNTLIPPFVAGYPPHGAVPFAFDGIAGSSFNARSSGIPAGGSIGHGLDTQHLNKFYGHFGFTVQPSFTDPLYMPYYQQPFGDAYNVSGQFDPSASRGGVIGSQVLDLQKGTDIPACSSDQKSPYQKSGGLSNLNPRRWGSTSLNHFGSATNMGALMQYPTSPLASPGLPGSPLSGSTLPGGGNELKFPPGAGKAAGVYSGWQGQRGYNNSIEPKTYSFLEELKSGKGRRFELSDIAGHIVELSADQHGSRFIQQKLENCSIEDKASVFKEVLPHASRLITDVFGNYVIQKFFEYGSPEQRKELANQLKGQILPLSLQMYGCRVIQKALEVIELEQKTQLVHELDGHVMRCVRDQNGNHVIQKCIECIPMDNIAFIISSFRGQVAALSRHPYGCRVIQRVLEHSTDELQSHFLVDEILESVYVLAQDQYGNYVTQHVLERGKHHERSQIISKLSGHIVQLSQHKFASNVIEKCLEHADTAERELLIGEIFGDDDGNDNLLTMMKDQFANYVVQKILEICADHQREILLSRIRVHLHALKKYTYGKHIVARFEQMFGEDSCLCCCGSKLRGIA